MFRSSFEEKGGPLPRMTREDRRGAAAAASNQQHLLQSIKWEASRPLPLPSRPKESSSSSALSSPRDQGEESTVLENFFALAQSLSVFKRTAHGLRRIDSPFLFATILQQWKSMIMNSSRYDHFLVILHCKKRLLKRQFFEESFLPSTARDQKSIIRRSEVPDSYFSVSLQA